jgi:MFS family permease
MAIGARAWGGGTLNLVNLIMSDITEMRERGKYMAFNGLLWAIGVNIGVGGFL